MRDPHILGLIDLHDEGNRLIETRYLLIHAARISRLETSAVRSSKLALCLWLMLRLLQRAKLGVCCEIHTKHVKTLCGQNVNFCKLKLMIYTLIVRL